jgi:hypothetical protein
MMALRVLINVFAFVLCFGFHPPFPPVSSCVSFFFGAVSYTFPLASLLPPFPIQIVFCCLTPVCLSAPSS